MLIALMLMVLHDDANDANANRANGANANGANDTNDANANDANGANANPLYSVCLGQSVIVLAPGTLWDNLSQCWDRLSRF